MTVAGLTVDLKHRSLSTKCTCKFTSLLLGVEMSRKSTGLPLWPGEVFDEPQMGEMVLLLAVFDEQKGNPGVESVGNERSPPV